MKKLYVLYILNVILVTGGMLLLFFVANIWLGIPEQREKLLQESLISYFSIRLAVNIVVALALILLIWLINLIIKNIVDLNNLPLKKIAIIELLIFTGFSAVFILIGL
ncbi:MAG TPA: hypothetical protein VD772_04190 [Anseongella sp.]|nr:hypothetical protein [Anseongella sp.]